MESRDLARVQRDVAVRVAELRRNLGLTQSEFADRALVSAHWVRRIEGGTRDLKMSTLVKLARCLGVDVSELFTRPSSSKAGPGRPKKAKRSRTGK